MQYFTIVAAFLAAVAAAAAAPTTKRQTYYEVGLSFRLQENGETIGEPAPIEINTLTQVDDAQDPTSAYEIVFDGTSSNVDISKVECRAYKDTAGVVPGSAPFTQASPAELATPNNPVEIASVLCYITE